MKRIFLILALFLFLGVAPTSLKNKPAICPMGMVMAASQVDEMKAIAATYDNIEEFQEQQQAPCDPEDENCTPSVQTPSHDPNDPNFNGNPGDPEPHEACTPYNRPDGKMPCTCLKQNSEGCKAGERQAETIKCNSYCWKKYCHCCKS